MGEDGKRLAQFVQVIERFAAPAASRCSLSRNDSSTRLRSMNCPIWLPMTVIT